MKNKSIVFVFLLVCSIIIVFSSAFADLSGKMGKMKWKLSDDGVLTISGSGKMPYFDGYTVRPWEYETVKEVVIQKGIKEIDMGAFCNIKTLKKVSMADSVTMIRPANFQDCINLEEITLSKNLVSIEYAVFSNCKKLISITIPEKVTEIHTSAFEGCSKLKEITLPTKLKALGRKVFYNCPLIEKIVIPNGVQEIYDNTFTGCSGLKKIIIPKSLRRVDGEAFGKCTSLEDIYYWGTQEEWEKIIIEDDNEYFKNATVHVIGTWDMKEWEENEN